MDTGTVSRVLRLSGILLALVIVALAAHPAAAEPNNGTNKESGLRDRINNARQACTADGGTFSVTLETSQGRAHTTCNETDGSTHSCTHGMTWSDCKMIPPPPQGAPGRGTGRAVGDILLADAEITQAVGPLAAPSDNLPAVGQQPTVVDDAGPGTSTPAPVEAEPEPEPIPEPVVTEDAGNEDG